MTVIEPDLESFRKPVLASVPAKFEAKWGKGLWDRIAGDVTLDRGAATRIMAADSAARCSRCSARARDHARSASSAASIACAGRSLLALLLLA